MPAVPSCVLRAPAAFNCSISLATVRPHGRRPLFAGGHWVPGQILAAGGAYSGVAAGERSRVLPAEEIAAWAPEVIFIAPCGYEQVRCRDSIADPPCF